MRDPQDVKPVMLDSWGSEVYAGETVYLVSKKGKTLTLCIDNFRIWIKELSDDEIVEAFGIERREV